ncbi:MAG TPA: PAS domain-containing protein, partial [Albitalea sp.]|nr:PAS domain-containing protein [Albitalea sp.]
MGPPEPVPFARDPDAEPASALKRITWAGFGMALASGAAAALMAADHPLGGWRAPGVAGLLLLAAGCGFALIVQARTMSRALRSGAERERRFHALLDLAADWHWEQDTPGARPAASSENRYRQLFLRSPTPLVLHRNGIVFDANEAAARMFGFDSVTEMSGYDLRRAYVDPDSLRRMLERTAKLEAMPAGGGLPVE